VSEEQARLAEAPRRDEPYAAAIACSAPEERELLLAIDQQIRRDGPFEAERRALRWSASA